MSVELLLLRHGHAVVTPPSWDDRGDYGRQLSEQGEQQSRQVGEWIRSHNLQPDSIICSSAVRSMATAIEVCVGGDLDQALINFEDSIYEAEVLSLVDFIRLTTNKVKRLMLVGHNPGLEKLASQLVGNVPKSIAGEVMSPATLVHIVLDGGWPQTLDSKASCEQVFRPD